VRRWKPRTTVADGSHVARRLAVSLTDIEQRLVLELRTALQLPLDDIVEVMHRCVSPKLSRSAIHRCLKRHGVSARPKPARRRIGTFETAGVGFVHIDLKHLTRLNGQPSFVFVAIDRATRFVHIESIARRDAVTVALSRTLHRRLPAQGAHHPHRQRVGVHRPLRQRKVAQAALRHRPPSLRSGMRPAPHRAPPHQAVPAANQRPGRALQPPPCRGHRRQGQRHQERGQKQTLTHAQRNAFLQSFVANYNRTRLKCLDYRAPAELLLNPPGPNTCAG
jgi:hypothetical protein